MMIILLVYQKTKVQFFLFITNSLPMFFCTKAKFPHLQEQKTNIYKTVEASSPAPFLNY